MRMINVSLKDVNLRANRVAGRPDQWQKSSRR
jgi:hypothetical protein